MFTQLDSLAATLTLVLRWLLIAIRVWILASSETKWIEPRWGIRGFKFMPICSRHEPQGVPLKPVPTSWMVHSGAEVHEPRFAVPPAPLEVEGVTDLSVGDTTARLILDADDAVGVVLVGLCSVMELISGRRLELAHRLASWK